MRKKNKRGNVFGIFVIIAVIFVVIVSIYIAKIIFNEFSDAIEGVEAFNVTGSTAMNITDTVQDSVFATFPNMLLIILIGLMIFFAIVAFQLRTHPAFFPITAFVVLPVGILVASIIQNVHQQMLDVSTAIAGVSDSVVYGTIMNQLPLFVFGFGVILLVVTYGLNKAEGLG